MDSRNWPGLQEEIAGQVSKVQNSKTKSLKSISQSKPIWITVCVGLRST